MIGTLTSPPVVRTADTLERGDVFEFSKRSGWVVCTEPSDTGSSFTPDTPFRFGRRTVLGKDCCEPRVVFLGKTGRMTHEATYIVLPNNWKVRVVAFLDPDIRGAVPERHPLSQAVSA